MCRLFFISCGFLFLFFLIFHLMLVWILFSTTIRATKFCDFSIRMGSFLKQHWQRSEVLKRKREIKGWIFNRRFFFFLFPFMIFLGLLVNSCFYWLYASLFRLWVCIFRFGVCLCDFVNIILCFRIQCWGFYLCCFFLGLILTSLSIL